MEARTGKDPSLTNTILGNHTQPCDGCLNQKSPLKVYSIPAWTKIQNTSPQSITRLRLP